MGQPISRYPVPSLDALPDDLRTMFVAVQEKAGFIPNVFLALAHHPDECRAFFAYHDAIMLRAASTLTKAEREMIVVATSGVNHCTYCVVAHGALLRIYAKQPLVADQVAIDHRKADITPKQKAMLDFAVKLARTPEALTEADREVAKAAGWTEEDLWDIGAVTAFFGLSNRMAHLTEMRANDEFHLMGRVPR
ncbi:MAG: peroxidase-related enzyme [Burkholderiales bacterium]|jgi:uncharacterized peroxidase-related enzyme|nr:peroxidase-related enzyme [Burkholderiales bacterium]